MPDEIKWIKLSTDFFGDRKIKQIRAMPDGDAMLLIWLNLLVLAGLVNDGGLVYLTRGIPYTEEMLAEEMRRSVPVVRAAISLFRTLNMVEDTPDGLLISNWEKHQSVDGMERAKQKTRDRVRRFREREAEKKALPEPGKPDETPNVTLCNVTDRYTVTPCNADVTVQNKNKIENKKEEIEGDNKQDTFPSIEKDVINNERIIHDAVAEEENVSVIVQAAAAENPKISVCTLVGKAWNKTEFPKVRSFPVKSPRGEAISALSAQYGTETILAAIEKAKQSEFLNELGDRVTLDWFLQPEHFQKIIEGQYDRKWERLGGEPRRGPNGVKLSTERDETDGELDRVFGKG